MKKKFRIAVEGATTDGRTISAAWITQMAKNYDPKVYGARINLEHFRGVLPDGPFKAYGDVVSLSAEKIGDGSALDGKLALYAEIDPTPELIELSKKRQKVYSSMEVNPEFGDSKEAYLEGLAITDSPASLGTEMLKFAAGAAVNPLATRKRNPGNLFSEAVEMDLVGLDDAKLPDDESKTLFSKVRELLGGLGNKFAASDARLQDAHKAIELLADNQKALADQVAKFAELSANHQTLKAAHDTLQGEFAALVETLDKTPDQQYRSRPPATGGGDAQVTDC